MTRPLLLLVWLFVAGSSDAFTAAWKVPLGDYFGDLESNESVKKLDQAPAKSAFFEPGDELWDISEEVIKHANRRRGNMAAEDDIKWAGEWMVWNARSQMIVVRGSEVDIMFADVALDCSELPLLARTKLELVQGTDQKFGQLTMLSASGESASTKVDGIESKVRAVDIGSIFGRTENDILVSWQSGGLKAEVSAHLDLYDGRTRIARFGTGKDQWELFASGGLAYSHGVSISEVRWKEQDGKLETWPVTDDSELAVEALDDQWQIGIFKVSPGIVPRLGGSGDEAADDPFGEETKRWKPEKIPVSKELVKWIGGEQLDLKFLLQQNGMKLDGPKAYAGFDAVSNRLFVISSPFDIELCEQIVGGIGCFISKGAWTETDAASGNWGLACRSGEESWIKLTRGDRTSEFKIRPDFADAYPKIDTNYKVDLMTEGIVRGTMESRVTLLDEVPSQIGSYQLPESKEVKVTLTVDVGYP